MRLLLGYGLTISFGQFAFLFCAIKFGMPAGLASLVLQAQAFFTIILGAGIFGERLQVKQLVGIALAVVGVLVLIQASFTGQHIPLLGFMLTLAGAFSWACGNIFNKKNYAAQLAPGGDVAGGVERADPDCAVYGLLADFRRPGADAGKRGGHRYHDAAVAGLSGVYRTILGYGIWGTLLGRYETWRVAPLSLLVPVVGMASAALLLDEKLSVMQLAGAVLVMAGLYINVFGFRLRRAAQAN